MIITLTAVKEKIRRKEFYIVSFIIDVLILLLFDTGTGSININGVAITDYKILAPILLIVVNAITCIFSTVMSLNTIPNEYERKTSHLVWIRNIPQYRYHGELAISNFIIGLLVEAILFCEVIIFMINNGKTDELLRLFPVYLLIGINVAIVTFMTSALTIIFSKFISGVIAVTVTVAGLFHGLVSLLKDMLGGFGGEMIKYLLKFVPNLHAIQSEAAKSLSGNSIDIHTVLVGLLFVYLFVVLIFVLKRKEA